MKLHKGSLGTSSKTIGKVILTDGTNDASINSDGQLHVVLMGKVDDDNSSAILLDADAVFTGIAANILDYGFIFITVFSDVASATDGLSVEQSSDGINWDNTDEFTIPAGTGKTYSFQPATKWFRVVYTNGGTNQATFRLQTVYKKTSSLSSSHRISNNLSPEDDASLQIAIIKGQDPNGNYVDYSATVGGNFKVSVEEIQNRISTNNSTTSVLDGDAVFTGVGDDVSNFANITIQLDSSHDSATDGMTFQFSTDNTNWDDVYAFTYTAANGARRFQFPATAQYFRVVYTNGSTLQTHFRVQTILHVSDILTTIHRISDNIVEDNSTQLVKSVLTGKKPNGDFTNFEATANGNFKVSLEEIDVGAFPTGINGGDVTVGTTETEMTFTGTTRSIMIQSKVANTGSIWVGLTGITNSGGNAFAQLSPGQSVSIELNDASAAIFAISDVAAQTVYKVALT